MGVQCNLRPGAWYLRMYSFDSVDSLHLQRVDRGASESDREVREAQLHTSELRWSGSHSGTRREWDAVFVYGISLRFGSP